jgi:hypothetical protein
MTWTWAMFERESRPYSFITLSYADFDLPSSMCAFS